MKRIQWLAMMLTILVGGPRLEADAVPENLVYNSSFELALEPNHPCNWSWSVWKGGFSITKDEWKLDETGAHHGRQSLRIDASSYPCSGKYWPESLNWPGHELVGAEIPLPPSREPQALTVSVALKSLPAGMKVEFGLHGGETREVTLSTEWERFSLSIKTAAKSCRFYVRPKSAGIYWVDAVQIEKGGTGAEYVLSPKDAQLAQRLKGNFKNRTVRAVKTDKPPVLDGVLDDAAWKAAGRTENFFLTRENIPTLSDKPTEVLVLHDDRNLYFGLVCSGVPKDKLHTKVTARDGPVWADDSVEIFIDTKRDQKGYYQLVVNSIGTQTDLKCDGVKGVKSWSGEWKAKCGIQPESWSTEIVVPFATLGLTAADFNGCGINFTRNYYSPDGNERQTDSWSYFYGATDQPNRFGKLLSPDGKLPPAEEK